MKQQIMLQIKHFQGVYWDLSIFLTLKAQPLKQHYVEIGILYNVVSPAVSECNKTVISTNPRSITINRG